MPSPSSIQQVTRAFACPGQSPARDSALPVVHSGKCQEDSRGVEKGLGGPSRGEWGVGWASIWPCRQVPPPSLGGGGRVISNTAVKSYKYLIGYKLAAVC